VESAAPSTNRGGKRKLVDNEAAQPEDKREGDPKQVKGWHLENRCMATVDRFDPMIDRQGTTKETQEDCCDLAQVITEHIVHRDENG
jgi:hypothetical protein